MTDDSPFSGNGNPSRGQQQSQVDPLGPVSDEYTYWSATTSDQETAPVEVDETATTPTKSKASKSAARAVREIVETLLLALIIFVAVRALVLNFRVDGS